MQRGSLNNARDVELSACKGIFADTKMAARFPAKSAAIRVYRRRRCWPAGVGGARYRANPRARGPRISREASSMHMHAAAACIHRQTPVDVG